MCSFSTLCFLPFLWLCISPVTRTALSIEEMGIMGFIQRNNTIFCFVLILLKILNRIVFPKCLQLTLCWSFWTIIHFSKIAFITGNRGFKVWQEWLFPHPLFFIRGFRVKFTILTPTGFVSLATYPQHFQIISGL